MSPATISSQEGYHSVSVFTQITPFTKVFLVRSTSTSNCNNSCSDAVKIKLHWESWSTARNSGAASLGFSWTEIADAAEIAKYNSLKGFRVRHNQKEKKQIRHLGNATLVDYDVI